MALNLPPDPYLALGVSKDAKLPEIRSAHRKLVLKCHPDKVQDAALKAEKQDEFQKVQQAYEILSDDTRRLKYDEQVKLFELRKEMGRGVASPRSNPFEFEVRTPESRPTAYATRSRGPPPPPPKIYTAQSPPKTYDSPKTYDDLYEKPLRSAKKSSSYESSERRREEERQQRELRKRDDEEKERLKREKEKKRAVHSDRKKTRDKEKRRETDDKRTRSNRTYIEDDTEDEPLPREKTRSWDRQRLEEEIRLRNDSPRVSASPRIGTAPLTPKWDGLQDNALAYLQASRSKAPEEGLRHPGLRRGETFGGTETAYNLRYTTATKQSASLSDDDTPRRSSFRRRASEAPPSRSRDTTRKEKEPSKRSSSTRKAFGEIVEPASPLTSPKTPKLKTTTSAPPLSSDFLKPARSKTEYSRKEKDPSIPSPPLRAQTFQSGDRDRDRERERDRDRDRGRDREGSKLRQTMQYDSPESDSEGHIFVSPRGSRSPPRPPRGSRSPPRPPQRVSSPRRREAPETTRYSVSQGNAVPKTPTMRHHRTELRNVGGDDYSPRDRSESPRGTRKSDRPPPASSNSRQAPQRSHSQTYYTSPGDPVVIPVRPKLSRDHTSGGSRGSPLFAEVTEVKYSPSYRDEDVHYSPHAGVDPYRRGSEPGHRDTYPSPRSGREQVFAN